MRVLRLAAGALAGLLLLTACGSTSYDSIDDLADVAGCATVTAKDVSGTDVEAADCDLAGKHPRQVELWSFPDARARDAQITDLDRLAGDFCIVYGDNWLVRAGHVDVCEAMKVALGGDLKPHVGSDAG